MLTREAPGLGEHEKWMRAALEEARLAARLTGYKIDIKPESYQEPEEEAPEAAEEAPASVESVETVEPAEE